MDFTGSEDEIYAGIRELVSMLPSNNEDDMSYEECTDDLNRASETLENAVGDPAVICSEIGDDHVFVETKAAYAKEMATGFHPSERHDGRRSWKPYRELRRGWQCG